MNRKVRDLVLTAMFTALIAVGAFIKFPMLGVPMTMQSFFVVLAAFVLRKELAALSVVIYILLGLLGLPVFASGGGLMYVFSPSFGYLLGFIVSVYFISYFKDKLNLYILIPLGAILVYVLGVPYFVLIQSFLNGKFYDLYFIVVNLFLIYLPKDLIFAFLAHRISKLASKVLK